VASLPWRDAAAALARVPTGAHLVSPPGMGAPTTLLAALGPNGAGRGWTLSSGLLLDVPFLDAVDNGELAYRTWHVAASVVDRVADGRVGYVPARASAVPALLARWGVDAALVRVSPPGPDGTCSLGPSTSYAKAAIDLARMVIAEVDPAVPWTCGDSLVPVACFDSMVESTNPIAAYHSAPDTEISRRIAANVLDVIPRDPTLQIGFGAIPESLLRSLPEADLGRVRFVGMGTDLMVDLLDGGPRPALLAAELMGTATLLKFADRNPAVAMASSALVHDSGYLAGMDRFVSVNTALEVDLAGNANCEALRGRQISGPGGGPDFVEGAARSPGGLRIVALPAATTDGSRPRIVSRVETVTLSGAMNDVVITEYGVARLAGLTLRQRADALTAIAHPEPRDAPAG
jgi:acyl-CoA hydrolase